MKNIAYLGNYHTHTQWCNHSTLKAEQAVVEAVEAGLTELGFSEHAPFYDDRFFRVKYSELWDYIYFLQRLKLKYANIINIRIGLEIEFFEKDITYYKQLYREYELDYLILGQHYFDMHNSEQIIKTKTIGCTELLIRYAETISSAMKTGLFKIVAHPDYCFSCDLPLDKNAYKAMEIIVETAKLVGALLEINANGLRKPSFGSIIGNRKRYPFAPFWRLAAQYGVKCIIGSDAHHPGCIYDEAVKEAFTFVEDLGITVKDNNILF